MIEIEEIEQKFPKSYNLLLIFLAEEIGITTGQITVSALMYFLDSQHLFIGITSDEEGIDWFVDLCSLNIDIKKSRQEAEDIGIREAFEILERTI